MEPLPNSISAFDPPPATAEFVIHSITSRDTTLAAIGAHCGVTVETLTAWLATPAIRARLEAADSTTCHAIRIRANVLTPLALAAATQIINDFLVAPTPRSGSIDPALLNLRRAETARKAAALIVRLTSHQPAHIRRAAAHAPVSQTPGNITPAPSNARAIDNTPTPAPRSDSETALNTTETDSIIAPTAPAATADPASTSAHADQAELPAPQSSEHASTSIAPDQPDSPAPTAVQHVLDLIAILSPDQIAELTALTASENPEPELALTAEDSS